MYKITNFGPDGVVTKEFLQDLVDMAVKHQRSITFMCPSPTSDELRKTLEQIDMKSCIFRKGHKAAISAMVIPPNVIAFQER